MLNRLLPLIPVKTHWVTKKIFKDYVWDISTSEKVIYLTFDDGPTPEITHWTLNTLKQFDAKSSFFCIGKNIENHLEIFRDILKEGHAVGNHTFNHVKGWKTKTEDYIAQVDKTQEIINSQVVNSKFQIPNSKSEIKNQQLKIVNLFRPPYGQITSQQGKRLIGQGYKIIMWDVLSFDWDANIKKETCLNHVISKATNGSIVVFHDSEKASKNMQYALPKVLEHFSEKGFVFKSLS